MYAPSLKVRDPIFTGTKACLKVLWVQVKVIHQKETGRHVDKETPLLSSLFPNQDLTKFGKIYNNNTYDDHLAKNSKIDRFTGLQISQ
ncbi:MAG TPA: hypothetical protein VER14_04550 [Phototrophicaceae bacterium]|nr:hypothetical protein [Phototrophicaceae bacterium]